MSSKFIQICVLMLEVNNRIVGAKYFLCFVKRNLNFLPHLSIPAKKTLLSGNVRPYVPKIRHRDGGRYENLGWQSVNTRSFEGTGFTKYKSGKGANVPLVPLFSPALRHYKATAGLGMLLKYILNNKFLIKVRFVSNDLYRLSILFRTDILVCT